MVEKTPDPYKATIFFEDIFGKPYQKTVTIFGEHTHGFNLPSGAWSLYAPKDGDATPAIFIEFVEKGKRKHIYANSKSISKICPL